jgi:hypothetical protein
VAEKDNTDLLTWVCQNFEAAEQATVDYRDEAETARDYFDGVQWTAEERNELKARRQPCVTDNMLKDKIETLIGMEVQSRSDPKAYPRTPQDDDAAEAATDALRYVGENNDIDQVVSDIAEHMFVEGYGGCEVVARPKGDDVEIRVILNPWDRTYFDPHSVKKDFSDARYRGTFVWLDVEDAQSRWPDVDFSGIASDQSRSAFETSDDKPRTRWYDTQRKRVRIVEQYYIKGGEWYSCKFVKGQWIEKPSLSAYNAEGETDDPYCWMSAYVDRDGARYGIVRRYKDLQDEVNHRRSKALHILNTNQVIMETGAVQSVKVARREANRPDGVIEIVPGTRFDIEKNNDLAAGQAQLLADARGSLSSVSPSAADAASSASGRSKIVGQQLDFIEVGRQFDQIRALKRTIYRKIWHRVQQFWTDEKWVRVRDDEGRAKFAQLNAPVTAAEQAEMMGVDPRFLPNPNAIVGKRNDVTELDVDIIIDESPDVINLQAEQFQNLVSLAQAGVVFPPEVYLEASSLRNKSALVEKLTGGDNPEAAAMMQQEQMTAMQERMAEIEKDMAQARKYNAEAEQTEIENMAGKAGLYGLAQDA